LKDEKKNKLKVSQNIII